MTPEEKVSEFKKELDILLKKYNFQMGGLPQFPIYNILPDEVNLALKVLEKHGIQYTCSIKEVKNTN